MKDATGAVMRSITTGEGLADLIPALDKIEGIAGRRAKNIALDQTRKAYAGISRQKLMSNGVKQFEWVHSGGGLMCALAGLVLSSRLMSGQPNAGVAFEMDAIAAVVMGGTSISGGRGSIIGTLIGAMMLGVLNNGLNMMGVSPYVQNIIKGLIILFAIYISRERRKKR